VQVDIPDKEILLRVEKGTVTQSDDVKNYLFRSDNSAFDNLNLYDYVAGVTKFKQDTEDH